MDWEYIEYLERQEDIEPLDERFIEKIKRDEAREAFYNFGH